MHPFALGFLQQQQSAQAPNVDWEAAAKRYSSVRAPSQQQQHQEGQETGGKRKRPTKRNQAVTEETTEEDNVLPPDTSSQADGYAEGEDQIGTLLREADEAPYSYETLNALVSALSNAGPEKLEEYEAALERLLFEYPLLFGYWKKLARLQCEQKGDWTKCEEVFERALEFVGHNPLIWVAYFEWLRQFGALPPRLVRAKMDQAIKAAGAHWKAWPLWQTILEWEEEELFSAKERILAAEQGASPEETDEGDTPSKTAGAAGSEPQSLIDINKACMQTALERLRLLYAALLKTPLESSDLTWDRLKSLVERGSRSSSKSRRGPRPGGASEAEAAAGGAAQKGASTLVEVYDLLTDEQLPLLLQRLQQRKSATLDELQMPAEAAAADAGVTQQAGGSRAAIKARGKEELDATLAEAEKRQPFEKAVSSSNSSSNISTAAAAKSSRGTKLIAVAAAAAASGGLSGACGSLQTHRWFWHPDPLAPRRLQAWREYLDFEEKHAPQRLDLLQRRCLEHTHSSSSSASSGSCCLLACPPQQQFFAVTLPPQDVVRICHRAQSSAAAAALTPTARAATTAAPAGILSRARESLPKSLPLLLLQLRLLQQLHAGSVEKILSSSKPLLAELIASPDVRLPKPEFPHPEQHILLSKSLVSEEAATAFLEKNREAIVSLAAKADLRRLPQQLLLPYGDKESEAAAAAEAAAGGGEWAHPDSQAHAEVSVSRAYTFLSPAAAAAAAAAAAVAEEPFYPRLTWPPFHPDEAAAISAPCSTTCCSGGCSGCCSSSDVSGGSSRCSRDPCLSPSSLLDSDDGILKYISSWSPHRVNAETAAAAAATAISNASHNLLDACSCSPSPPTKRETPGSASQSALSPVWPWLGAAAPSDAAEPPAPAAALPHAAKAGCARPERMSVCRGPAEFAAYYSAIACCCHFPPPSSPVVSLFPCLADDFFQQQAFAAAAGDPLKLQQLRPWWSSEGQQQARPAQQRLLQLDWLQQQQEQIRVSQKRLQQQQQQQKAFRKEQGDAEVLLDAVQQSLQDQFLQQEQLQEGRLLQQQASLQQDLQEQLLQEEEEEVEQLQQQQRLAQEGHELLSLRTSNSTTAAAADAADATQTSESDALPSQQQLSQLSNSSSNDGSRASCSSPRESSCSSSSSSRRTSNNSPATSHPWAAGDAPSPVEWHSGCSSGGSNSSKSSKSSDSSHMLVYASPPGGKASPVTSSPLLAPPSSQRTASVAVPAAPTTQQSADEGVLLTTTVPDEGNSQQEQQDQQEEHHEKQQEQQKQQPDQQREQQREQQRDQQQEQHREEQQQQREGKEAHMCVSMSSSATASTAASTSAEATEAGEAAGAAGAAEVVEAAKKEAAATPEAAPQLLSVRQLVGRHIAEAGRGLSFMRCFSLHNLRLALETGSLGASPPKPLEGLTLNAVADALCSEAAARAAAKRGGLTTAVNKTTAGKAGDEDLRLSSFLPGLVALQEDWLSFAAARVFVFSLCSQLQIHPEVSFLAIRYMGWLLLDWNSWQPPPELLFPGAAAAAEATSKSAEDKQQRHQQQRRQQHQQQHKRQQQQQPQEETAAANKIRVSRVLWGVPPPPQQASGVAGGGAAAAAGADSTGSRSSRSSSESSNLHPLPVLLRLGCLCTSLALRQLEITPPFDTRQLAARAAGHYAAQRAAEKSAAVLAAASALPRGSSRGYQQQQQQQRQQQQQQRQQQRQRRQPPLMAIANLPLLRHQWDPQLCPSICSELQQPQQQRQQEQQQQHQPAVPQQEEAYAIGLPFPLTGWLELFAWGCISNFSPKQSAAAEPVNAESAAAAGEPAAAEAEGDISSQASSNNLLLWLLEALKLRSSNYGAQWLHQQKGACSKCCCSGRCSSNSSNDNSNSDNLNAGPWEATLRRRQTATGSECPQRQQTAATQQQQQQHPQSNEANSLFLLPRLLPDTQPIHLRGGHQLPQVLLLLLVGSPHPASVFLPPAVHAVGVLLLLLQSYPSSSSSKLQQLLRAVVGPQLLQQSLDALKLIAAAIAIAAAPRSSCCARCGCCCPLPLPVQHKLQQLLHQDALGPLPSGVSTTRRAAAAAAAGPPAAVAPQLADGSCSSSSKRKKRPLDCNTSTPQRGASPSPTSDLECPYSWPPAATTTAAAAIAAANKGQQRQNSGHRSKQQILITADDSPCQAESDWRRVTPRNSSGGSRSGGSSCRSSTGNNSCPGAAMAVGGVAHRPQYQASPFSPWGAWSVSEALSNKQVSCFPSDTPCCCSQQPSSSNNTNSTSNAGNGVSGRAAGCGERPRRPRRSNQDTAGALGSWSLTAAAAAAVPRTALCEAEETQRQSREKQKAWQQHAYQQQLQQHYAALGFDCSQLYSCYNETLQQQQQQQQQQHLLMYGERQQQYDGSSWNPSEAAAAASAGASTTASSASVGTC
ncbi:hypothetical protein Emag_001811 [Eimeria magna]